MKSALDANNLRALEEFLYDLICEMKQPDEMELLVDVLLTIQQPPSVSRCAVSPAIPSDHPATGKQGRAE
jgi:hypothetical protein